MEWKRYGMIAINIFCILNIFFLSGCNKKTEPIKIGVLGTMSGINSDLSVSGRRGIEIAMDEINKEGGVDGREFELEIKDDMNNANIAQKDYEKFFNEKISFVIGPYTSGMIVNSIDYLKNKDILVLGPTISADSLSKKDDNFIRFIASTKEQAVALIDVANKNNNKKFAIVYDVENSGFNEALYNNFKELLEKNNGQVVLTNTFTSSGESDFCSIANNISKSNADGIFIIGNSADNAEITQQLRKIKCNIQIYSPLWSNTTELIKKGGTAIEGMFIVGGMDIDGKSNEFTKFKDEFFAKYGENPTFASVYSYETTKALYLAMKMGPDLKVETIKKNIIKIRTFKGLQGDYQIDKWGDNTRKYMIFRVENGQLRKVD